MTLLHELPPEHELRNKTLAEIGAECRNLQSTQWREVKTWAIGRVSYNQLGECWVTCNEFRAP